ncbi:MAG: hypothetical protein AAGJ18_15345 [Bacteroidota bacterium]
MNVLFAQLAPSKKIIATFLFAAFLIIGFSYDASAQRDRNRNRNDNTEDYFDESGVGGFRFWYGGGVGLNFGSGFNTSQFNFSLSPMVGYKLTPEFSVGPRVELAYSHIRVGGGNNVEKFNFIDYGIGAFTRYKLFTQFFAHAEYQIESRKLVQGGRISRNNFFFGGGYTSGGQIGYEISVLWNFLEDTADLPLDYRIAFTYNF